MGTWRRASRDALISGSAASIVSTSALLACGAIENGRPLAPVNAISHWYWGERAANRSRPSFRHTMMGYVTHHVAAIFWAVFYEKIFGRRRRAQIGAREFAEAAAISALACFVDYRLTPRRLTPGYEKQVSRKSLFVVYTAFALGLAVGGSVIASRGKRS
ncbi:MAG TPA: hypothetical protein VGK44_16320 [Casimicrobiaceae bacterium]|jgi:hypothetical protein